MNNNYVIPLNMRQHLKFTTHHEQGDQSTCDMRKENVDVFEIHHIFNSV